MVGASGGAIYLAGGLSLIESSFTENSAGEDGLAIGSSNCGFSLVQFIDVYFADNGMRCPIGKYQRYNYVVRSMFELQWRFVVRSRYTAFFL